MVECGGIKLLQLLQITLSLPIYTVNLGVFWVSLLKNCKRVVGGGDLALLVVGVDRPAPRLPPRHQPLQHHQGYRLLVTRPEASTSLPPQGASHPRGLLRLPLVSEESESKCGAPPKREPTT